MRLLAEKAVKSLACLKDVKTFFLTHGSDHDERFPCIRGAVTLHVVHAKVGTYGIVQIE